MRRREFIALVCSAVAVTATNSPRLLAQDQPGFAGNKVTPLVKVDLTGVSNKQVIANIYEVPPATWFLFTFIMGMNSIWSFPVNGPQGGRKT